MRRYKKKYKSNSTYINGTIDSFIFILAWWFMLKKRYENMRLRYCDGKDKYFNHSRVNDVEKIFVVVLTEKMCDRSLSSDLSGYCVIRMININPRWYEQHIYETTTWPTWPKGHIPQRFEFSKWFIVVFRLMKYIIFNESERFVGTHTSDQACQIFCSKGNCETIYH
jgi:hypothetical protein